MSRNSLCGGGLSSSWGLQCSRRRFWYCRWWFSRQLAHLDSCKSFSKAFTDGRFILYHPLARSGGDNWFLLVFWYLLVDNNILGSLEFMEKWDPHFISFGFMCETA